VTGVGVAALPTGRPSGLTRDFAFDVGDQRLGFVVTQQRRRSVADRTAKAVGIDRCTLRVEPSVTPVAESPLLGHLVTLLELDLGRQPGPGLPYRQAGGSRSAISALPRQLTPVGCKVKRASFQICVPSPHPSGRGGGVAPSAALMISMRRRTEWSDTFRSPPVGEPLRHDRRHDIS
jgi:hypothetical protein